MTNTEDAPSSSTKKRARSLQKRFIATESTVGEKGCLAVLHVVPKPVFIRRVTPAGVISVFFGHPSELGYREGAATHARFNIISGLVVIGSILFVSDHNNHCIRSVPLNGKTSHLFAGSPGMPDLIDGANALFAYPCGLTADETGNLFVADSGTHSIRMITPAGLTSTLAGCDIDGYQDGPAKEARFYHPVDVALDGRGNLLIVESCRLRAFNFQTRTVSTVAGDRDRVEWDMMEIDSTADHRDGPGAEARFEGPHTLAVDVSTGDVFIGCYNQTIRRVTCCGEAIHVSTLCGTVKRAGHVDGKPALLFDPHGLVVV